MKKKTIQKFLFVFFLCANSLLAQQPNNHLIVTASDYCIFLNAVAANDEHHLYDQKIKTDLEVASICQLGQPGSFHYQVIAGRENSPITFINANDAERYTHWLNSIQYDADYNLQENSNDHSIKSNQNDFQLVLRSSSSLSLVASPNTHYTSYWSDVAAIAGIVGIAGFGHELMMTPGDEDPSTTQQTAENEQQLTLNDFKTVLESHPMAERFVLFQEEGKIFIRPQENIAGAAGKNKSDNIAITRALRGILEQHFTSKIVNELFPQSKQISFAIPALSADVLGNILDKAETLRSEQETALLQKGRVSTVRRQIATFAQKTKEVAIEAVRADVKKLTERDSGRVANVNDRIKKFENSTNQQTPVLKKPITATEEEGITTPFKSDNNSIAHRSASECILQAPLPKAIDHENVRSELERRAKDAEKTRIRALAAREIIHEAADMAIKSSQSSMDFILSELVEILRDNMDQMELLRERVAILTLEKENRNKNDGHLNQKDHISEELANNESLAEIDTTARDESPYLQKQEPSELQETDVDKSSPTKIAPSISLFLAKKEAALVEQSNIESYVNNATSHYRKEKFQKQNDLAILWDQSREQYQIALDNHKQRIRPYNEEEYEELNSLDPLIESALSAGKNFAKSAEYSAHALKATASKNEELASLWREAAQQAEAAANGFKVTVLSTESEKEKNLLRQVAKEYQTASENYEQAALSRTIEDFDQEAHWKDLARSPQMTAKSIVLKDKTLTASITGNKEEANLLAQAAVQAQIASESYARAVQAWTTNDKEKVLYWNSIAERARLASEKFTKSAEYMNKATMEKESEISRLWSEAAIQLKNLAEHYVTKVIKLQHLNEHNTSSLSTENEETIQETLRLDNDLTDIGEKFSIAAEYAAKTKEARLTKDSEILTDLYAKIAKESESLATNKLLLVEASREKNSEKFLYLRIIVDYSELAIKKLTRAATSYEESILPKMTWNKEKAKNLQESSKYNKATAEKLLNIKKAAENLLCIKEYAVEQFFKESQLQHEEEAAFWKQVIAYAETSKGFFDIALLENDLKDNEKAELFSKAADLCHQSIAKFIELCTPYLAKIGEATKTQHNEGTAFLRDAIKYSKLVVERKLQEARAIAKDNKTEANDWKTAAINIQNAIDAFVKISPFYIEATVKLQESQLQHEEEAAFWKQVIGYAETSRGFFDTAVSENDLKNNQKTQLLSEVADLCHQAIAKFVELYPQYLSKIIEATKAQHPEEAALWRDAIKYSKLFVESKLQAAVAIIKDNKTEANEWKTAAINIQEAISSFVKIFPSYLKAIVKGRNEESFFWLQSIRQKQLFAESKFNAIYQREKFTYFAHLAECADYISKKYQKGIEYLNKKVEAEAKEHQQEADYLTRALVAMKKAIEYKAKTIDVLELNRESSYELQLYLENITKYAELAEETFTEAASYIFQNKNKREMAAETAVWFEDIGHFFSEEVWTVINQKPQLTDAAYLNQLGRLIDSVSSNINKAIGYYYLRLEKEDLPSLKPIAEYYKNIAKSYLQAYKILKQDKNSLEAEKWASSAAAMKEIAGDFLTKFDSYLDKLEEAREYKDELAITICYDAINQFLLAADYNIQALQVNMLSDERRIAWLKNRATLAHQTAICYSDSIDICRKLKTTQHMRNNKDIDQRWHKILLEYKELIDSQLKVQEQMANDAIDEETCSSLLQQSATAYAKAKASADKVLSIEKNVYLHRALQRFNEVINSKIFPTKIDNYIDAFKREFISYGYSFPLSSQDIAKLEHSQYTSSSLFRSLERLEHWKSIKTSLSTIKKEEDYITIRHHQFEQLKVNYLLYSKVLFSEHDDLTSKRIMLLSSDVLPYGYANECWADDLEKISELEEFLAKHRITPYQNKDKEIDFSYRIADDGDNF